MITESPWSGVGTVALLYGLAGIACAFVLARRERGGAHRATTAVLSLLVWPLWAPVALSREPMTRGAAGSAQKRIGLALEEAQSAVRGTQLASLLPEEQVHALRAIVDRAARRIVELEAMVARPALDAASAERRLEALIAGGAAPRTLASARVHLDNARKLACLLDDERRTLDDLADLADALRTQLVLARYAGSSLEGVGDMVSEVWARVQGLDAAMNAGPADAAIP